MVITIFRSRLRAEHEREYQEWAAKMDKIAQEMPGFISIKGYTAQDGERVSIVEFANAETQKAWREHPEHREAQRLGHARFYSEFRVQVCEVIRDHEFPPRRQGAPPA